MKVNLTSMNFEYAEDTRNEVAKNVASVVHSGIFNNGPQTLRLSKLVLDCYVTLGATEVVFCNSALSAFDALFLYLKTKISRVYFPPNYFFPVVMSAVRAGLDVTILPGRTPWVDVPLILEEDLIDEQSIFVDFSWAGFERLQDMNDDLVDYCTKKRIIRIVDRSHSFFATNLLDSSAISVFSFFTTKPLNIGSGGAVLLPSVYVDMLHELGTIFSYGRRAVGEDFKYAGYSSRFSEFQAAIGVAMWRECLINAGKRLEVLRAYYKKLLPYAEYECIDNYSSASGYKAPVFIRDIEQALLKTEKLRHIGIELGSPVYGRTIATELAKSGSSMKSAVVDTSYNHPSYLQLVNNLSSLVYLPCHHKLSNNNIDLICGTLIRG